jgi:hypothetical protein
VPDVNISPNLYSPSLHTFFSSRVLKSVNGREKKTILIYNGEICEVIFSYFMMSSHHGDTSIYLVWPVGIVHALSSKPNHLEGIDYFLPP